MSPTAYPSPAAAKKRDEELNRSVLGQLKPDYAKADGSFKHLRSILKDPEFRKVKDALRTPTHTTPMSFMGVKRRTVAGPVAQA